MIFICHPTSDKQCKSDEGYVDKWTNSRTSVLWNQTSSIKHARYTLWYNYSDSENGICFQLSWYYLKAISVMVCLFQLWRQWWFRHHLVWAPHQRMWLVQAVMRRLSQRSITRMVALPGLQLASYVLWGKYWMGRVLIWFDLIWKCLFILKKQMPSTKQMYS